MTEWLRPNALVHLGLWMAIAAVSILARILPIQTDGPWSAPDFLLALTLAWVLRRPAHLPAPAIALVFLAEDLFLMRPPGLWALVVVAGTEFLRRREAMVREMTLLVEWALVAAVMVAMAVGYRLALVLVMVPRDPFDLWLMRLAVTVLVYPLVVWFLQGVLRVRKPATGETDELGHRL